MPMSARNLASVVLAVIGIQMLIRLPVDFTRIWWLSSANGESIPGFRVLASATLLASLLLGLALLLGRFAIAAALFDDDRQVLGPAPAAQDLASALFAVAGLWFSLTAMLQGLQLTSSELLEHSYPDMHAAADRVPWDYWPPRLSLAAQFIAGLLLLFRARQFAAWWHALRTAGHVKS
jgi:hypothetical protein